MIGNRDAVVVHHNSLYTYRHALQCSDGEGGVLVMVQHSMGGHADVLGHYRLDVAIVLDKEGRVGVRIMESHVLQ